MIVLARGQGFRERVWLFIYITCPHFYFLSFVMLLRPNVGMMPCEMRFGSHLHTYSTLITRVVLYLELLQPKASILELLGALAFALRLFFTLLNLSFFQFGRIKCSSPHWSCRNKLFPNVRSGFRLFLPLGAHMCTMLRHVSQPVGCPCHSMCATLLQLGRKHPMHYLSRVLIVVC